MRGQRTLLKASLDGIEKVLGGHPTALLVAVVRENLPKVADLLLSERTCSHNLLSLLVTKDNSSIRRHNSVLGGVGLAQFRKSHVMCFTVRIYTKNVIGEIFNRDIIFV